MAREEYILYYILLSSCGVQPLLRRLIFIKIIKNLSTRLGV